MQQRPASAALFFVDTLWHNLHSLVKNKSCSKFEQKETSQHAFDSHGTHSAALTSVVTSIAAKSRKVHFNRPASSRLIPTFPVALLAQTHDPSLHLSLSSLVSSSSVPTPLGVRDRAPPQPLAGARSPRPTPSSPAEVPYVNAAVRAAAQPGQALPSVTLSPITSWAPLLTGSARSGALKTGVGRLAFVLYGGFFKRSAHITCYNIQREKQPGPRKHAKG